jgi:SAM-dependent methyltransferase
MSKTYGNLQKYKNPNPVQRWLIVRFLQTIEQLLGQEQFERVLDVGCAEGFVSAHLAGQFDYSPMFAGVDLNRSALLRGRHLFSSMQNAYGDAVSLPFPKHTFDLVICTEVLEHLPRPELALHELHRVARRYVLLSVPHEPWFRLLNALRGKHLQQWGNDPEHLNNWGQREFVSFVAREMNIVKQRGAFPWTLALCDGSGELK